VTVCAIVHIFGIGGVEGMLNFGIHRAESSGTRTLVVEFDFLALFLEADTKYDDSTVR
jgi:hypothetical protein